MFIEINEIERGIFALCQGELYDKARKILKSLSEHESPDTIKKLKNYIQNEQNKHEMSKVKNSSAHGNKPVNTDKLANLNPEEAISVLIERNDWNAALITCKKHSPELLGKTLAAFSENEFRTNENETNWLNVVKAYSKFLNGINSHIITTVYSNQNNFNIYKRILTNFFSLRLDAEKLNYEQAQPASFNAIETYTLMRNFLSKILNAIKDSMMPNNSDVELFGRALEAVNLLTIRANFLAINQSEMMRYVTEISSSLLRYIDLPGMAVDKVFFEAAICWKMLDKNSGKFLPTALFLFDFYIDLVDAIDEQDIHAVNTDEIEAITDIPTEFELPNKSVISVNEHEKIKKYVLAKSMDVNTEFGLILNNSGRFIASLDGNLACSVTGFPLKNSAANNVMINNFGKAARARAWEDVKNFSKSNANFNGIVQFLENWE